MSERLEFVHLAGAYGANMALLCRRFGISRKSGYKWLRRYAAGGEAALADRSRRPKSSPARTAAAVEAQVVALRDKHRSWGGRKIAARLQALRAPVAVMPSTVTAILHRHGRISPQCPQAQRAAERFERPVPNDLWQLDFKGHFPLGAGGRCHPLTCLDDHSRFCLILAACPHERGELVQAHLTAAFRRYGLPQAILCDNGPPWGVSGNEVMRWSNLSVWLLRLGVEVLHGRPYHPQTQGKEERFHRTLKNDVLKWGGFADCQKVQAALDPWRETYNQIRPHEGIGLSVPASRYQPSRRSFPEALPEIVYGPDDVVRRVSPSNKSLLFQGRRYTLGAPFAGHPVALRPTTQGQWEVFFCVTRVGVLDPSTGTMLGRPQGVAAEAPGDLSTSTERSNVTEALPPPPPAA